MEVMEPSVIDMIYRYGALPLLCIAVYYLWRKYEKLEDKLQVLNDAHKNDLIKYNEQLVELHRSTLKTLDSFTDKLNHLFEKK